MKLIGVIGLILVIITHVTLAVLYTTGTDAQYGVLTTTAGLFAALGWILICYYYYQKNQKKKK